MGDVCLDIGKTGGSGKINLPAMPEKFQGKFLFATVFPGRKGNSLSCISSLPADASGYGYYL
jgi:hypothetical protein